MTTKEDDDMVDGDDGAYSWEQKPKRSWEDIVDKDGRIDISSREHGRRRRKRRHEEGGIQRGMLRNVILVIDLTSSMRERDIKPSRYVVAINVMEHFVREYLDRNPLCNIGIVYARDSVAKTLSELSGVVNAHVDKIKSIDFVPSGEFSMNNAMILAMSKLKNVPSYMTREILMIQSSLNTIDASNIVSTIKKAKSQKMRCSIVSMASETFIFKKICAETGGIFDVATDKSHFRDILFHHVTPLPALCESDKEAPATHFVEMGFPDRKVDTFESICSCHHEFKFDGFFCPKCKTKVCELPTTCVVCGLRLVSSSHLARSYHHLFPVAPFKQRNVVQDETKKSACDVEFVTCKGCARRIDTTKNPVFDCSSCSEGFCVECDIFVHETLQNCPGCV
eukprot:g1735.t1